MLLLLLLGVSALGSNGQTKRQKKVDSDLGERLYTSPHYTEVSPCPCNLSPRYGTSVLLLLLLLQRCDTFCCCDPQCSQEQVASFPCTQGLQGGRDEVSCSCYSLSLLLRASCQNTTAPAVAPPGRRPCTRSSVFTPPPPPTLATTTLPPKPSLPLVGSRRWKGARGHSTPGRGGPVLHRPMGLCHTGIILLLFVFLFLLPLYLPQEGRPSEDPPLTQRGADWHLVLTEACPHGRSLPA